mmetsp:Transcript_9893/g.20920  ORF Transcript_9893/g.20920 Transcript_9893/m.20920 type:complete len:217 (+) Transcript_9893:457-1107(+)
MSASMSCKATKQVRAGGSMSWYGKSGCKTCGSLPGSEIKDANSYSSASFPRMDSMVLPNAEPFPRSSLRACMTAPLSSRGKSMSQRFVFDRTLAKRESSGTPDSTSWRESRSCWFTKDRKSDAEDSARQPSILATPWSKTIAPNPDLSAVTEKSRWSLDFFAAPAPKPPPPPLPLFLSFNCFLIAFVASALSVSVAMSRRVCFSFSLKIASSANAR